MEFTATKLMQVVPFYNHEPFTDSRKKKKLVKVVYLFDDPIPYISPIVRTYM